MSDRLDEWAKKEIEAQVEEGREVLALTRELHDLEFEHARVVGELASTEDVLLELLRAPYTGMMPWAITRACLRLGHPARHPGDSPEATCVCSARKGP